jgi:uncharacterized protein (DUF433 family)
MITHKNITSDPNICGGRPVVTGTGIRTEILFERFKAGESIIDIYADYMLRPSQIEDAIRFEIHELSK